MSKAMYNQKQKELYLDYLKTVSDSESRLQAVSNLFYNSYALENMLNTELAMFTIEQFEELFVYNLWSKPRQFAQTKSLICSYTAWCENNYLKFSGAIYELNRNRILSRVIQSSYPFSSTKEMEEYFSKLFNVDDPNYRQFNIVRLGFIVLTWNGMDCKDVMNIKNDEVDIENKSIIYKGSTIEMDDFGIKVIQECMDIDRLLVIRPDAKWYYYEIGEKEYLLKQRVRQDSISSEDRKPFKIFSTIKAMMNASSKKITNIKISSFFVNGAFCRAIEKNNDSLVPTKYKEEFRIWKEYFKK